MKNRPPQQPQSPGTALILFSAFFLGAAVLVVEILGARVISPYFGSSVYAWSAQITVTLAALAAGYLAGGAWADAPRFRPSAYFVLVAASGVLVLLVPFVKSPVLAAAAPLGLMAGSLASATLLFAPSLFLLSATGPMAIRLVTADLPGLGRGVGRIYAVSTAGSVLGALVTGFYLSAAFSVRDVFLGAGLALLLLGGLGLWLSGRRAPGGASSAVALLGALWLLQAPAAAGGLFEKSSFYGDVRVVQEGPGRYMLLDGVLQGAVDQSTGEGMADVLYYLEGAALFPEAPRRALVIGLGAGTVPMAYERFHGLTADTVEIDPVVAEAARGWFGFQTRGALSVADGRSFLERGRDAYDVVVLDAFASERAPFHLFSREAFEAVRRRLAPGGVFAVNTVGDAAGREWVSVYKTLSAVFPAVRVFTSDPPPNGLANLVFIAGEGATRTPRLQAARPPLRAALEGMLSRELPPPSPDSLSRAPLFTDDLNPMDAVYRDVMAAWRRSAVQMTQEMFDEK